MRTRHFRSRGQTGRTINLATTAAPDPFRTSVGGTWADELGDKPLARRICGDPIVLFRDGSGRAAALATLSGADPDGDGEWQVWGHEE